MNAVDYNPWSGNFEGLKVSGNTIRESVSVQLLKRFREADVSPSPSLVCSLGSLGRC